MKSNKALMLVLILAAAAGCNSSSGGNLGNGPSTTPATLASILVTPSNPGGAPATLQQFSARGTYSDNTTADLTASVTWSSSDAAVASISNTAGSNGLATSIAPGQTTITAASGSITGSTTLTVTSVTLASLAISPLNPSIYEGATQQFSAAGTYSDNTTQTPSLVSWSSSSRLVATISDGGLATAIATGTTLITAMSGSFTASTTLTVAAQPAGGNIVDISVNGSLCNPDTSTVYFNKPCVSVKVCNPGTSTCVTVNDLLLDTGSYGLRIFKSALTGLSLTQATSGSGSLTGCVQFVDGSSLWGPIMTADVVLAQEPAVTVPIQVIDASFGTVPASCGIPSATPSDAGFNGILGVGLFAEDCGSFCETYATNGSYYSCSGSTCTGVKTALASQVQNPVAHLPQNNNGVIVEIPAVAAGGKTSVTGSLILGIDTQTNNASSGETTYQTDGNGYIKTVFKGATYSSSFIDTGSNGLYFDNTNSALTICSNTTNVAGFFCPSALTSLTATNKSGNTTGTASKDVTFQIGNANTLLNGSNIVFVEIGAPMPGSSFDWGLPFYFGKRVYHGIEGKSSNLGTGTYVAY